MYPEPYNIGVLIKNPHTKNLAEDGYLIYSPILLANKMTKGRYSLP